MNGNGEKETFPGVSEESLSIEVTNYCNSACLHCFARAGIVRRSSLSVDLVKGIIAEGHDAGYRHLHITGGEPLLLKGLFETLDYSFDMGYKAVFLNTNGTLIAKDVGNRLAAYDCLSISVSLEGPEPLHDRLRGKGSYRRTVRGIERALDAGNDLIVFTTARKGLLPELPHFAEDLYKRFSGIKYLALIQLIRVTDNGFALSEELLEPEDFLQLVQTVSLLNLCGLRAIVLRNPLVSVVSKLIQMPWIPQVHPLYRDGSMIVMANRNITAVHSSRNSFGSYKPGMIQKVLASDGYRKAVLPDETTCPSCKYVGLCRENGMVRPSEGYRDMCTKVPYCKRVLERIAS
jgi:MoaA/NifB/PqqE/SkfB family radical SAM enzyme